MARELDKRRDIIDSREVIDRIGELGFDIQILGEELAETPDDMGSKELEEMQEELKVLTNLAEEGEGYSDWSHGATLIRDDYFETYAMDLARTLGVVEQDAPWPLTYIDWEAAAEALQQDYTSVDFDGVDYWIR